MVSQHDFGLFSQAVQHLSAMPQKTQTSRAWTAENKVRLAKKNNENTIHGVWGVGGNQG